ncbi:MAG: hypothetical protein JW818_16540 [Pirellulales bacterium]|nr:hypothetical protein [Pirellulales bacterium]
MQIPAVTPRSEAPRAPAGPSSAGGSQTAQGEELPDLTDPMDQFKVKDAPSPAANPQGVLGGLSPSQFDEMLADGPRIDVPRPTPEPERRPCPSCGELVVRGAARCRYCGEILDPVARAKRDKRERKRSRRSDYDDSLTTAETFVAIFCSGIGCMLGIVFLVQGKPKAGKMIGLSLMASFFWNVLGFVLRGMLAGVQ